MISDDILILFMGIFVVFSQFLCILMVRNNEKHFNAKYEALRKWYYNELEAQRSMYNIALDVSNKRLEPVKQYKKIKKIK